MAMSVPKQTFCTPSCCSDSIQFLISLAVVATYMGLQMLTVKYRRLNKVDGKKMEQSKGLQQLVQKSGLPGLHTHCV